MSLKPFEGKTILVTGASSGIGLGLCQRLDELGARLVLSVRNESDVKNIRERTQDPGHRAVLSDMGSPDSIEAAAAQIKTQSINLDGVAFCAGIHMLRPLTTMKSTHWLDAFSVNAIGPAHYLKCLVQNKSLSRSASIIFVSSIAALKAEPGASAYSASKGALLSLTRSFAAELASQRVRVNCVSPGVVDTRMSRTMFERMSPEAMLGLKQRHLLGTGTVDDVVSPMIFLMSDAAKWITGQNLVVDGGFSIT